MRLDKILTKLIFLQHRAAALLGCDRIVVLDEGRIIEEGSPNDLMQQQNGIFSAMVKTIDQNDEQWLWKNQKLRINWLYNWLQYWLR